MTDKDKIIEKIRKAQALADSGVGGEAINAAKFVAKLMAKHAISKQELEIQYLSVGQTLTDCQKISWQRHLLNFVCEYCQCRCSFEVGTINATIWGYQEDAEVAIYLFDVAKREIDRLCWISGVKGRKAINQWKMSAATGFGHKLRSLSESMKSDDEYAIVVSRLNDVDVYMAKFEFGSTKGTQYAKDNDAYDLGKNIQINKGVKSSKCNLLA